RWRAVTRTRRSGAGLVWDGSRPDRGGSKPARSDWRARGGATMDTSLNRALIDVAEAARRLRAGQMVLVTDDAGRENEADLIVAAEHATPAAVAFLITYGRGLVCCALTGERLDALGLAPMVPPAEHTEAHGTAFTISVDARHGTTTGISAQDRAATIRTLIDP